MLGKVTSYKSGASWPHQTKVEPNEHTPHWDIDQVLECVALPWEAENNLMWHCLCKSLQPYARSIPVTQLWDVLTVETRKAINAALERSDPGADECGDCGASWKLHNKDGSCVSG